MEYSLGNSSLAGLARLREYNSMHESSWDRTGGNKDNRDIAPGKSLVLADMTGPGCIKRIWLTLGTSEKFYPRKSVFRMYWDDSDTPSVEAPVGDFFGIGHGLVKNFSSLPLAMSPESGKAFNCYFPMPFNTRGRIELENQGEQNLVVFFNIDWEQYPRPLEDDIALFHAAWRRENPTVVAYEVDKSKPIFYAPQWGLTEYGEKLWNAGNLTGKDNYVILEAEGNGHYVGCNLNIDCFEPQVNDWYGEGDEMIFIDGEPWPPRIHGTGTEDYFNTAYCPTQEFCTPYYGITLYGGKSRDGRIWGGKQSMYRFHVEDPVRFEKSIRVTIEHGHNNALANDYSSTAYWYQQGANAKYQPLAPVSQRLPREY